MLSLQMHAPILWLFSLLGVVEPPAPIARARTSTIDVRWSRATVPRDGAPASIGGYNNGCVQGAAALAPTGPGYEVIRLLRRRFFGHPALVSLVRRLGAEVKRQRLGVMMIGDLAQPRGGPTPTGHRSHQTGLDVDIAFAQPAWAGRRRPTPAEREAWSPVAVVDLKTHELTSAWQSRLVRVLELAARDGAVDRVFVNPAIKRELCRRVPAGSVWLRKIRPWWAHHDHFHVRLGCPQTSPACEPQEPLPPGDGCDARLDWWFSEDAKTPKPPSGATGATPPPMPAACAALVE